MGSYRKKPIIINAWIIRELVDAAKRDWSLMPPEVNDCYEAGDIIFLNDGVSIKTLEGRMKGNLDDFLIQGVAGEFYPCKPDIFADTYEEVQ